MTDHDCAAGLATDLFERCPFASQARSRQIQPGCAVVGIALHRPEAGKMLQRGLHAAGLQTGGVGCGDLPHDLGIARDGALMGQGVGIQPESVAGGFEVDHRAQVEIDADGRKIGTLLPAVGMGGSGALCRLERGELRQCRACRQQGREMIDPAAFLVRSHKERRQTLGLAQRLQAVDFGADFGQAASGDIASGQINAADETPFGERREAVVVGKTDQEMPAEHLQQRRCFKHTGTLPLKAGFLGDGGQHQCSEKQALDDAPAAALRADGQPPAMDQAEAAGAQQQGGLHRAQGHHQRVFQMPGPVEQGQCGQQDEQPERRT